MNEESPIFLQLGTGYFYSDDGMRNDTKWFEPTINHKVDQTILSIRKDIDEFTGEVESMKSDIVELKIDDASRRTCIINVNDLGSLKYEVMQPIQCMLYQKVGDDTYYMESIDFDVYGTGESVAEVVRDIKEAIIVLFEVLVNEPDGHLADGMKVKKKLIKKFIKELDEG